MKFCSDTSIYLVKKMINVKTKTHLDCKFIFEDNSSLLVLGQTLKGIRTFLKTANSKISLSFWNEVLQLLLSEFWWVPSLFCSVTFIHCLHVGPNDRGANWFLRQSLATILRIAKGHQSYFTLAPIHCNAHSPKLSSICPRDDAKLPKSLFPM